jgi:hypothetical protein
MAEVSIQLNAEDRTPPVLNAVFENTRSKAADISSLMQGEARAIEVGWGTALTAIGIVIGAIGLAVNLLDDSVKDLHGTVKSIEEELKGGIEFKLDAGPATKALKSVVEEARKFKTDKTLSLNVSQAISAVSAVKTALASIPEVTYKDVVVRYQTMASPLRPFTEGMEYIRKKMESLPGESTHTIKYGDLPSSTSPEKGGAPPRNVHFAPTINITAAGGRDGGALAEEIDRALADRWRYNRSELKRAMNA